MYSKKEAKEVRELFWTKFNRKSARVRAKKGKQRKWVLFKTGMKGVQLKFELSQEHMGVLVEIYHRNVYKRLAMFEKFEQVRALLDQQYMGTLKWEDEVETEVGKHVSQIYERQTGVNIHDQTQWDEIMSWFIDRMISLEEAFMEVQPFLKPQIAEIFVNDEL